MSAKSTKKAKVSERDTLRAEYRREDLGRGVRGKYFARYQESTNVVVLEPDVAARFKNSRAVNNALRTVIQLAEQAKA